MGTKINEDRYAFVVEHYDKFGDRIVIYHLLYYPQDQCVEILDPKNKRIFLKKTPYPEIQVKDLLGIGTKLNVYARQYKIVEFGDEYTRNKLGKKQEKTLGIILPDYSMGKVIALINKAGIVISKMKMIHITKEDANDFLTIGGRAFSGIKEGNIIVMELQGEDCTRKYREVVTKTDSLYGRGEMGKVAYSVSDNSNLTELEFFFDGSRQFQYPTTFNNCTLCVIKPHSVMGGSLGSIIDNILEEGFEISSMAMFYLDLATAEEFLEVYKGVLPDFHSLVVELSSGGCVALEIRTENAVESFRRLAGPHDPELAKLVRPETLRAKFGIDKIKNAIHCTDLNEDGPMEVEYFFNILLQ